MVARARYALAAASAAAVVRILVACATSREPAAAPEAGPPGEAFTACEIQGYVSESDAGLCPEGTCLALAFDTNGAPVPCCTAIVGGAAMCVDGAAPGAPDASEAGDAAESASEADVGLEAETAADAAEEAGIDASAPESGSSQDAADAE